MFLVIFCLLRMLLLGVDYCNSLFRSLTALDLIKLQSVQNSLARITTNTIKYSHSTHVRTLYWLPIEQVLYSRLSYWCTSSYIVVSLNTLYLSLNTDKVFITHVKAQLMVCSLSPTLCHFSIYISLPSILASACLMMLQKFGIICLVIYV